MLSWYLPWKLCFQSENVSIHQTGEGDGDSFEQGSFLDPSEQDMFHFMYRVLHSLSLSQESNDRLAPVNEKLSANILMLELQSISSLYTSFLFLYVC